MTNFFPFMARRASRAITLVGPWLVLGLVAVGQAYSAKAVPLSEQTASPWVADLHSALRLIEGPRSAGAVMGAIAIRLDSGWKTYWQIGRAHV
jgi:DsbC/DsbD-like thiol-disulfide interchange protein